MEVTFLEDMYELMQASHFRLLSGDDWDTAQDEQFTVSLPASEPHQQISPASLPDSSLCNWTSFVRCQQKLVLLKARLELGEGLPTRAFVGQNYE